jgi:predicted DNA-binding helix-hairpin-helix protein
MFLDMQARFIYFSNPLPPLSGAQHASRTGIAETSPIIPLKRFLCAPNAMVPTEKVRVLSELSSYDMEQEESVKRILLGNKGDPFPLYDAKTPKGKCTLFKTLMANNCKMDCKYCVNSRCSKRQEAYAYTPEELVHVFMLLYKKRAVQGLFLSSAILDSIDSMENTIEAARILRERENYRGYMHLKILPGSSMDQVKRAVGLADRVSINLETASASHLSEIASNKDFRNDILKRQAWVRRLLERRPGRGRANNHACTQPGSEPNPRFRAVSHTSQVMVGVNGETDREIFSLAQSEYDHMGLSRMYYSAFKPLIDTPMEHHPAAPRWRQNRLYQLDWLYRVYGYSRDEVHLAFCGDFLANLDPKAAIARTIFGRPLEINGAEEGELLRVPGIGPNASKSLSNCKERPTSLRDLKKHGVILSRALPFIKINGLHQTPLSFFN